MSLDSHVKITHIGTATVLLELEELTIITDPYFSPQGTEWVGKSGAKMTNSYEPALDLTHLPPLDLVLLSHEDHKDNLDDIGRQLLNGRLVLTTIDGSRRLQPRPGVRGLKPWESLDLQIRGRQYTVVATPCEHLPGGECIGFVLTAPHFGKTNGKPNAIYFSGDTVYIPELAALKDQYSVSVALLCLGKATVPQPGGKMLQITMDVEQGVRLADDIGAKVVIPVHFEGWSHFKESRSEFSSQLHRQDSKSRFRVLEPGIQTSIPLA